MPPVEPDLTTTEINALVDGANAEGTMIDGSTWSYSTFNLTFITMTDAQKRFLRNLAKFIIANG